MRIMNPGEVVQFAVRIEENGRNFYRNFAENLKAPEEKAIFGFLADEEEKHVKLFEKMLSGLGEGRPRLNYPDEYYAYLQAYADNLIFTVDSLKKEAAKITNAKAAADFGIRRELDSILYYQEIKAFVPKSDADVVDQVIREERKHFLKLTQMKKEMK